MKKLSLAAKNAKPLSIALVYDDSLDGNEGVAHQVKLIGAWLAGRGHMVSYLCGQTSLKQHAGGKIYSLAKNVPVSFNGNKLSIPLPAKSSGIKTAIKEVKADVLHVQMPHSPFMAQKVVNRAKLPTAGTFHIYPANWLAVFGSQLLRRVYGRGLKRFDEVVSVSSAAQAFAHQSYGLVSSVVPNAVDVNAMRSKRQNRPMTVVFLGRLVERKGARELIKSFALVSRLLPEARLVIGGNGDLKSQLVKLAQDLGIEKKVEFKGFIKEEAKADFLAEATVACFPSLYGESFGIVLIEAMAAGAGAVLAGNNPGYASVMEPRPDLLVDAKNTEQLAARLIELLKNNKERADIKKWQASYVKQFDIDTVGRQLESLYSRVIAKHAVNRHN